MPLSARIYLCATISAGALVLSLSLWSLESADAARLAMFLLAATLASVLKIRLPGISGSITPGFVVVLLAVAELSLAGTVAVCTLSGLVQTLWMPKRRPQFIQVVFNTANLTVCGTAAHWLSHVLATGPSTSEVVARLASSLAILFALNVTSVSLVVCLIEGRPIASLLRLTNYWAFPYYMTGTAIAAVLLQSASLGIGVLLLELPLLYFMHLYYSFSVDRPTS